MEDDPVGLVGNNGLRTALDDGGAQLVAAISFVTDEGGHGWCKREHLNSLTGAEVKNDWRQSGSLRPWILVVRPPRERPKA
jgi:hypothetical protein